MKKIPTIFERDPEDRSRVSNVPSPECAWVFNGEGAATRKWDGTCVMLSSGGGWWARRTVRKGKPYPDEFVEVEHDETTGKSFGWEPVANSPFIKQFSEAFRRPAYCDPGTYELVGPDINGNPENKQQHLLIRHGFLSFRERADRVLGVV